MSKIKVGIKKNPKHIPAAERFWAWVGTSDENYIPGPAASTEKKALENLILRLYPITQDMLTIKKIIGGR